MRSRHHHLLRRGDGHLLTPRAPEIEEVLGRHAPVWMELPGVVGTGIGRCRPPGRAAAPLEPCIRVFLAGPSPEAEAAVPRQVEGYRVELVVTGSFGPRTPGRESPESPDPTGP